MMYKNYTFIATLAVFLLHAVTIGFAGRYPDDLTRPYRPVHAGDVPFFNVDHSPAGANASFVYGMVNSGGLEINTARAEKDWLVPHKGVIIAVKSGTATRIMPLCSLSKALPVGASYIKDTEVKRTVGACTDVWTAPLGLQWTHYTPHWILPDIATASLSEKRRAFLPATWMVITLDNSQGSTDLQFLFSLKEDPSKQQDWGGYQGYTVSQNHAVAVRTGEAELLTAAQVQSDYGINGAGSAFKTVVAPGGKKTLTILVAHYYGGKESFHGESVVYYYTSLFKDLAEVLRAADSIRDQAIDQSKKMDRKLAGSGINQDRQFLAGHGVHSYQFNTQLWHNPGTGRLFWVVKEGECAFSNTLDLTVDQLFFEMAMHPWTVRNVLDLFLDWSFVDQVKFPGTGQLYPGGLSFHHDMGWNSGATAGYRVLFTQEELINWVLCAGVYCKVSGDTSWLKSRLTTLKACLSSMKVRDNIDSSKRDGICSMQSVLAGFGDTEITTYDCIDAVALGSPIENLYIGMKCFACYLSLEMMFKKLGQTTLATESATAARKAANTIESKWDGAGKAFPACFNGTSNARIIPAVEGLIYPYLMGLTPEVTVTGPYGSLISKLKTHIKSVLVPGVCINKQYGSWWLSSTGWNTWISKILLSQYITEQVLGIKDSCTGGVPDATNYAYQVLLAPNVCATDQAASNWTVVGCRHYPRLVTSSLWWLPLDFYYTATVPHHESGKKSNQAFIRLFKTRQGLTLQGLHANDRVQIFDLHGRLVRQFAAENATLVWDGRNACGMQAPAGEYLLTVLRKSRTVTIKTFVNLPR